MLEIDITDYVYDVEHSEISGSVAELGYDAAAITWRNSQEVARGVPFLATTAECDTARDWLAEFGAWEGEELCAMSDDDIRALVAQFVSGDVREAQLLAPGDGFGGIDWQELEQMQAAGTCAGYMGLGDNGRIYYSLA